jgi:ribonucleoside-diphosphate reductase alpha chain
MKKDILAALDKGDIEGARDILLAQTIEEVGDSNSWDSPNYIQKVKTLQEAIPLDQSRSKLLTYFGLETLRDRYFLRSTDLKLVEGPQQFFARVAAGITLADQFDKETVEVTPDIVAKATELYDVISKLWFMPATPVLTNTATDRGSVISCFLSYMGDSVTDIFKTVEECAHLGAGGGGLGVYMGDVRGHGAPIRKTLKSSGPIPFMKILDSLTLAIQQGSVRRCSAAVHMDVSHPDVESFIDIRRPTGGDENRRCLNLHHGLNITDEFMSKVTSKGMFDLICPHTGNVVKQVDARALWKNILKNRVESGEPYLTYIDSVHKQALPSHTEKGLKIRAGNLCQEIILPTNKDRTAICVLASINIEQCPLDQLEYVSAIATEALDNVLTLFLKTANPRDYKRAIYSASREDSFRGSSVSSLS